MTQKSYEHQPPDFTVKWHCTLAHSYSLGDGAKAFIYQRKAIGPGTVTHRGPDSIVAVYIFKNEKLSWLSYLISLELKTTQTKSHTKLIRKTRCLWSIFGKRDVTPYRYILIPKYISKLYQSFKWASEVSQKQIQKDFFPLQVAPKMHSETKQYTVRITWHSDLKISAAQNDMVSRLCVLGFKDIRHKSWPGFLQGCAFLKRSLAWLSIGCKTCTINLGILNTMFPLWQLWK